MQRPHKKKCVLSGCRWFNKEFFEEQPLEENCVYIDARLNQLDDVIGKRSRAIQRTLKNIETSTQADTNLILPESDDMSEGNW